MYLLEVLEYLANLAVHFAQEDLVNQVVLLYLESLVVHWVLQVLYLLLRLFHQAIIG